MRYLIMSFLAVAMLSTPALAQDPGPFGPRQGDWELSFSGFGDSDRNLDTGGFAVTGELGHYLTRNWMLGLRQDINWRGGSDTSDDYQATSRGVVQYHFDAGQWRPFLGLNVGYKCGRGSGVDTGTLAPEGGVKWYADETTFLFGRMGYDIEFRDAGDIDRDRGSWTYAVGIGFNF